jgi:histone-lysine N-methyltransferase SETD8
MRKSARLESSNISQIKQDQILKCISNKKEDGLELKETASKGLGVFAKICFNQNDFITEYAGELISQKEAKMREEIYSHTENIGCYMLFFNFKNRMYCVDATYTSKQRYGRFINHSRLNANCFLKIISVNKKPVPCVFALRHIEIGEELLYDYGDRRRNSLSTFPWLKS